MAASSPPPPTWPGGRRRCTPARCSLRRLGSRCCKPVRRTWGRESATGSGRSPGTGRHGQVWGHTGWVPGYHSGMAYFPGSAPGGGVPGQQRREALRRHHASVPGRRRHRGDADNANSVGKDLRVARMPGIAPVIPGRHRTTGPTSSDPARLVPSWRHSGSWVDPSVTVPPDDCDGLKRRARSGPTCLPHLATGRPGTICARWRR